MSSIKATWDESKHPRHPEGKSEGGQFASSAGDAPADDRQPDGEAPATRRPTGKQVVDGIQAHLRAGGIIGIKTALRMTLFKKPEHAEYFKVGSDGRPLMRAGKRWDDIGWAQVLKYRLAPAKGQAVDNLARIVADAVKAAWDESEHPRHPAGSAAGGQFAPKGGSAGDGDWDPSPEEFDKWLGDKRVVRDPRYTPEPAPKKEPDGDWNSSPEEFDKWLADKRVVRDFDPRDNPELARYLRGQQATGRRTDVATAVLQRSPKLKPAEPAQRRAVDQMNPDWRKKVERDNSFGVSTRSVKMMGPHRQAVNVSARFVPEGDGVQARAIGGRWDANEYRQRQYISGVHAGEDDAWDEAVYALTYRWG